MLSKEKISNTKVKTEKFQRSKQPSDLSQKSSAKKEIISETNKLESEIKYEATLVSRASFMTAAFSFSTSALFSVWKMGIDSVVTIPKGVIHTTIGVITLFLLLCIFFSIRALMPITDEDYCERLDLIKISNKYRVHSIRRAIYFWYTALALVFISTVVLLIIYYVLPGNLGVFIH